MTYFTDVIACYRKHGFIDSRPRPPAPLTPDVLYLRMGHIMEELAEFAESQGAHVAAEPMRKLSRELFEFVEELKDAPESPPISGLADGGDALLDIAVLALGTGALMHLPMDPMWYEVTRANLARERGTNAKRGGHGLDLVKPPGWYGPQHQVLIDAATRAAARNCYCIPEDVGHEYGSAGCMHEVKL